MDKSFCGFSALGISTRVWIDIVRVRVCIVKETFDISGLQL
jgi:hypothetical protein